VATCAEVEIDEAERLKIVRLVTVFECGAIVNPDGLRNQVEGAMIMGLGGALFEEMHFADGMVTNGSFSGYRVPRLADIPDIEIILVDRPDLPSVGGSETPIVSVAPAIANAIVDAVGTRLTSMPLAPDGRVRC
jgi:isoquinoline 1-oxidoreductase